MTMRTRLLLLAASLLLAVATQLPVWRIGLVAPQYPEGMGMQIRLDGIEGVKAHDLENINELNHYIGMRLISADDMPELRVLPLVVLGLAAAGIAAAAAGRRGGLYAWAALFGVASVAGLADFWWRTYSYGHELDVEHAVIKIPGMAYQPPMLGVKQILNFRASAWPDAGGIAIGVAAVLTVLAVWWTLRDIPRSRDTAAA